MRRFHAIGRGVTLLELIVSMAAASIAMLIGLTAWGVGWTQYKNVENASRAYLDAFGVMNSIQEQVQRANTIDLLTGGNATSYGTVVGSPGSTNYSGVLLLVPNPNSETNPSVATNPLRRAYWLSGNNLLMQWPDESIGPITLFSDVTSFSAAIQNSPTNSLVKITCTCADGTETITMSTVACMRN
ncbi:MAG: PilW family protein [Candidatus Brocadiia bacterium]